MRCLVKYIDTKKPLKTYQIHHSEVLIRSEICRKSVKRSRLMVRARELQARVLGGNPSLAVPRFRLASLIHVKCSLARLWREMDGLIKPIRISSEMSH